MDGGSEIAIYMVVVRMMTWVAWVAMADDQPRFLRGIVVLLEELCIMKRHQCVRRKDEYLLNWLMSQRMKFG